jgi:hypothetical protein
LWESHKGGFHLGSILKLWPDAAGAGDEEGGAGEEGEDDERPRKYPSQLVRRHEATWGWILESCWTLETSWAMPAAEEEFGRGDLARGLLTTSTALDQR